MLGRGIFSVLRQGEGAEVRIRTSEPGRFPTVPRSSANNLHSWTTAVYIRTSEPPPTVRPFHRLDTAKASTSSSPSSWTLLTSVLSFTTETNNVGTRTFREFGKHEAEIKQHPYDLFACLLSWFGL